MEPKLPTPKRLSALLTLMTGVALVIVMITLSWVALRLATTFNENARHDAVQRVESGLDGIVERLKATSLDYSNWTEHYLALQRQDIDWLAENVGSAVDEGGVAHLVILSGGPVDSVLGWSTESIQNTATTDYIEINAFAAAHVAQTSGSQRDFPLSAFLWIGDALWLITIDQVVPHTAIPDPDLLTSQLVLGIPLSTQLAHHLGDTLLLSDVRIQSAPGDEGASHALPMSAGRPAWVVWSLPSPGNQAILSVIAPTTIALGLLLAVLGAGVYAVRVLAADLERALITAEAANKAKSEFLTNMSHEIRTPLNGVLGMAELMADTRLENGQRAMLETIKQSGDNLLSLINDILDLSRIESGKLTLESSPFPLSGILARIEALHGTMARAKGIQFEIRRGAGAEGLRLGDEMRVLQILHNVLGNAVKFTEAGRITLEVEADHADHVVFRVTDTGIGMTDEQVSRFFVAFEQAESGTTRRFGGSGLGMSIAQRLVDIMEGNIAVSSTLGHGTVVTIRLSVPSFDSTPEPQDAPPLDHVPDQMRDDRLKGCHLLVAEDNATNRKILALMLDKLGVQAVFAENGAEACKLWQDKSFDIVLMDISMPVMDGFAALEAMQGHSLASGRSAPRAIAATANVMTAQIDHYKAAGFVDILPKPIKRAALHAALLNQLHLTDSGTHGQGPALA